MEEEEAGEDVDEAEGTAEMDVATGDVPISKEEITNNNQQHPLQQQQQHGREPSHLPHTTIKVVDVMAAGGGAVDCYW